MCNKELTFGHICFFDLSEREDREDEGRLEQSSNTITTLKSSLIPSRLPLTDPDGLSLLNSPSIFPSAGSDGDIRGQVNSG